MTDFLQTWNLSLGESKEDIGGENSPPLNQNSILGKKEGGTPQIRWKLNHLGFGSNFQGNLGPTKDCD